MSQPCCWNSMNAAFMQYEQADRGPGEAGPGSPGARQHHKPRNRETPKRTGSGVSADVEDAEAQGYADAGDDPEADDDGGLGPAGQLEVVLQRGHPEYPLAGQLERSHLDD